jgi:hypothetical protein
MLLVNLDDSKKRIASANNDIYKRFWNEDGFGRIESPKPEESCRDVLVDLLRTSFQPLGIIVEPEGHMVTDKRADIVVLHSAQKIPVELKRDYHSEVWTAAEAQLDRFYTRDPEASGFGVYGVFWFGQKRPRAMPLPPDGRLTPQSAAEMEAMLRAMIPEEKSARIAVVVIDVSGETSLSGGPAPTSRSPDPKSSSRSG